MRKFSIPAIILIVVGIAGAVVIAVAWPADPPAVHLDQPVDGLGGAEIYVPAAVPGGCRHAYAAMSPAWMATREALKGISRGEPRQRHAAAIDGAHAELARYRRHVDTVVLDCGSADVALAALYRSARVAVEASDATLGVLGDVAVLPLPAEAQLDHCLVAVERALAGK